MEIVRVHSEETSLLQTDRIIQSQGSQTSSAGSWRYCRVIPGMIPSNTMIKIVMAEWFPVCFPITQWQNVKQSLWIKPLTYFNCEGKKVFKNLRSIQWGINGATLSIPCNAIRGASCFILFLFTSHYSNQVSSTVSTTSGLIATLALTNHITLILKV